MPNPAPVRERVVERYFRRRVRETGGDTRKVRWLCRRGAPDRFAFWPEGRAAFVEMKRPGGKPEPHQAREIGKLRAAGILVVVIDSIEAVDRFVQEMTEKSSA